MAKACSCRPSELLGIDDSYAAFCLDEAVVLWGESIESELEKVAEKAKTPKQSEARQQALLDRWLKMGSHDPKNAGKTQQFAEPPKDRVKRR